MANNLLISYDLFTPGKDYKKLIALIHQLGVATRLQLSHWYVSSLYNAEQAANLLKTALDANDTLVVIDATNNRAMMVNLPEVRSKEVIRQWSKRPMTRPEGISLLNRTANPRSGIGSLKTLR